MDPTPGTLRAAIEEIEADSESAPASSQDYVVVIAPEAGTITLDNAIELALDEGARSFTLRGDDGATGTIDLNGNDFALENAEPIERVAFSGLSVSNGVSFLAESDSTGSVSLEDVTFSAVDYIYFSATADIAATRVRAENGHVELSGDSDGGAPVALTVSDSSFASAPVHADLAPGNVTITGSSFTGAEDDIALEVSGYEEDEAIQNFTLSGSTFSGNESDALHLTETLNATISDTVFESNEGESAAHIEGPEDFGSLNLLVTGSRFASNDVNFGPLRVTGTLNAATVATTEFSENWGEQSGGVHFDGTTADTDRDTGGEALLTPRTLRFEDNTVTGNGSGHSGSVDPGQWLQYEGATVNVDRNFFSGNSSVESAADFHAEKLGEGFENSEERLSFTGNTLAGSTGAPGAGQAISIGWVHAADIALTNNTFDVPSSPEPALYIDDLDSEGSLGIAHNTFAGGGVAIDYYEVHDPSPISVTSTVFDTPGDPFTAECECEPALTESDVVTRSASALLPDAALASEQEIALAPLADNGGPTQTRLPGDGSVLLGAAQQTPTAALDQRGVARPAGPGSDIGAVEQNAGAVALDADITVVEGSDVVIPVDRTGADGLPLDLPTQVTLRAVDGTAIEGVDFTGASATAAFPAGTAPSASEQRETVTIPTVARAGSQGTRAFTVEIASTTNGAAVGTPETITVTITDKKNGGNGDGDGDNGGGTDNGTGGGKKPTGPIAQTGGDGSFLPWAIGGGILLLAAGSALVARRRITEEA